VSRSREIELKLDLDPGGAEALKRHPLLARDPAEAADQLSTYFDAADQALRAAGFSLRVRGSRGRFIQTVKQSSGASAGLFDRPEWEREVVGPDLDFDAVAETPLGALLDKKMRKRLKPLITVEVLRSKWDLEYEGSRIELILDEGRVTGGKSSETIAEVELELKAGEPAHLIDAARAIGDRVPLRLGVLTKAARGYRLADGKAGKVTKSEPIELRPDMSAAEGFAAIASACLRHFRLNESLVVEKRDAAALHQARVAMRRLRSAFTLFRPVIADERYWVLREEVRWFTDQLGDARNIDVLLKRFSGGSKDAARDLLRERLEAERETAYAAVLEALGSQRLRSMMIDLVAWLEMGEWRSANGKARLPLPDFASERLDKRWRKVKKGGAALGGPDAEPRHQLRIEVKKLRYAVEFLASLTEEGDRADRQAAFIKALEEMQEQLGELNDIETARVLLQNLLGDEPESREMMRYATRRLQSSRSEGDQIEAAEKAHAELVSAGRFWR
jgi:inorganic triphosphatase YgiF